MCVEQLLQISKRYEKLIKPGKTHFSSAHVHRDQMKNYKKILQFVLQNENMSHHCNQYTLRRAVQALQLGLVTFLVYFFCITPDLRIQKCHGLNCHLRQRKNIARIANAVQVTICLLVSTSVY